MPEFRPASPAAGNTIPRTSDSTICTNSAAGSARTSQCFHHRCPRFPGWLSLAGTPPTRGVLQCNKVLSRSCRSSPQVDGLNRQDNAAPSLHRHYSGFLATTSSSAPHFGFGILPHGVCHLLFPFASETRFSRSIPKPELRSCRLYTGCHRVRKQVSPRLVLGMSAAPSFDKRLKIFDASSDGSLAFIFSIRT